MSAPVGQVEAITGEPSDRTLVPQLESWPHSLSEWGVGLGPRSLRWLPLGPSAAPAGPKAPPVLIPFSPSPTVPSVPACPPAGASWDIPHIFPEVPHFLSPDPSPAHVLIRPHPRQLSLRPKSEYGISLPRRAGLKS